MEQNDKIKALLEDYGATSAKCLAEMVAALNCDYDRLEELRSEREYMVTKVTAPSHWASYLINGDSSGMLDAEIAEADQMVAELGLGGPVGSEDAGFCTHADYGALAADCQTYSFLDQEKLKDWQENGYQEDLAELEKAAGECTSQDEARERIQEDALSVEVRSGWVSVGSMDELNEPEEFQILLSTGGPASRIIGELRNGEPYRARLQVQDWFLPWVDVIGAEDDALAYASVFYFGES